MTHEDKDVFDMATDARHHQDATCVSGAAPSRSFARWWRWSLALAFVCFPVPASALLTALAVDRSATVDPGSGAAWRAELPPDTGWADVAERPAADWAELVTGDLRAADGPHGPSEAWLDETAATVPGPAGSAAVRIPRRCLFALSGLGLLAEAEPGAVVRVVATGGWLRLDVPGGAVVRRRQPALPLLF